MRVLAVSAMRAVFLGLVVALLAGSAFAQTSAPGTMGTIATIGGLSVTTGPRAAIQNPTPLATVGNLAFGIWTRVPPPYDVAANRTAASNPLP